jgi:hypothetical protein
MLFAGSSFAKAQAYFRAAYSEETKIEADNPATKSSVAGVASILIEIKETAV